MTNTSALMKEIAELAVEFEDDARHNKPSHDCSTCTDELYGAGKSEAYQDAAERLRQLISSISDREARMFNLCICKVLIHTDAVCPLF